MDIITNEQAEIIKNLVQFDMEAVEVYQQAMKQINDPRIYKNVSQFCETHEAHIQKLTETLLEQRYQPPVRIKDFNIKNLLIKSVAAIKSMTSTTGALKIMQDTEELGTQHYNAACSVDFPEYIKDILAKNLEDEKRQLNYLNSIMTE